MLSSGNLKRLGLARALLHEPELLILDEPANGLDPAGVVEIRQVLAGLVHEHGVTVFMSSHILTEVDRLATRIGIILKDPERARALGLIGVKAQMVAGVAGLATFLQILMQGTAVAGAMLFAFAPGCLGASSPTIPPKSCWQSPPGGPQSWPPSSC